MADLNANNPGDGAAAPQELGNTPAGDEIDTGTETEGDEPESPTEPELDEVDYEGKKYKIPKELAPALLRQSDYTKKTQEVADRARANEERETAIKNNERVFSEHRVALIEAHGLDNQVKEFEKVNWQDLNQKELAGQLEKGSVQTLWLQYQQLKDARDRSVGTLQQKIAESSRTADAAASKRREESHAAVARDIKDWNPQTFDKVKDFGSREFGLKAAEMAGLDDPRFIKVLHRAFEGTQAIKELAAMKKAALAEDAKPLPQVGSNASANTRRTTDPSGDGLSAAEWVKRENERLRAKRTAARR